MENNLLKKEEEFHKLNAELELKTNELMKEVESVMKIQDRLSKNSTYCENNQKKCTGHIFSFEDKHPARNLKKGKSGLVRGRAPPPFSQTRGNSAGNLWAKPLENDGALDLLEQVERLQGCEVGDIVPDATKGMGNEALIRFLKAKLRLLQDTLESLQDEHRKQVEESRHAQAEARRAAEERDRWRAQVSSTKELLSRQEQAAASAVKKLAERDAENAALRKEVEMSKKEMKQTSQTYSSNEIRLNRALEEVDKLKSFLKQAKLQEKELRELSRKKKDDLVVNVRRLEKQKTELVAAFKRQLQLIDNLKKQKAHLEASRVLQFTEEDFLKLLDWSPTAQRTMNKCRALD